MEAKKVVNISVTAIFIAAEIAVYITFLSAGLSRTNANYVKYAGVVLCAVFALYCCINLRLNNFLLAAALIFTITADWFLLIVEENFEIGLAVFIIAQLLHFARIYLLYKKLPCVSLILRLLLCGTAIILLLCLNVLTLLTALVCVYFLNLLANFADSFLLLKTSRLYALLTVGLFLFICCDICVGLFNFGKFLNIGIPAAVRTFADKGMWAFYLPSQTLIVLSGEIKKTK